MTRLFEPEEPGAPRLFATSLGVDFCAALIEGLDARLAGQPPEAIARVEILVANARMLRRLQALYLQRGPGFLPRLRTVAGMSDLSDLSGLDAAMPPLRLRLKLADLVRRLIDGDPELAPRAAIYPLADSLADLMGEMFEERVTPEAIAGLDMGAQSGHWARSQAVLGVVETFFGEDAAMTAEARQARLVDRLARRWREAPPDHPVLIAGSTGSRGATLRLMDAVSRLPQGAVLLPGLDRDMPESVWTQLTEGRRRPGLGGEDHPQYRLARVAGMAGVAPGCDPRMGARAGPAERCAQSPRVAGPASCAGHRPVARGRTETSRPSRGASPCHLSRSPQPPDGGHGDRPCPPRGGGKRGSRRAGQPRPESHPAGRRRARPLEHHAR
jgi:ATP-dependent helicase/nuclease subunit B